MYVLSALSALLTHKIMKGVFIVFLLAQGYLLIRPSAPPLDPVRAEAAERVAAQVAEAIGAHAGGTWSSRYVRVARFQGDPGDHLRARGAQIAVS